MKEEKNSLIYELADYKQLVLQYTTRFSQQAKDALFWKIACGICLVLIFCVGFAVYLWMAKTEMGFVDSRKNISQLNIRLQEITVRLDQTRQELGAAKEELKFKAQAISRLEQGVSSASKSLVENLLKTR